MTHSATPRRPSPLRLAAYVLLRPRLYGPALRTAWRFRDRRWYRRPPFLPVPPADYVAWRFHTAYGDGGPGPADLGRFLRWAARMGRPGAVG